MALAVKHTPETGSASAFDRLPVVSLLGLVYVLGCLAILFKVLPYLWYEVFGLSPQSYAAGTLLALVALAAATGLLMLGVRLLGPNAPVGARAGVFATLVGLLAIVLLTRWASLWIEHWVYYSYLFGPAGPTVGAALTAAIGLGLAALGIRWLFKPTAERALVALENQGWFSTTEYKPKQGQKVRRGTIAGLLVIALAGIYTLHSHHTLRRGAPDWQLNVPFTGVVLVENPGDVADHLPADLPTRPGPDGVARPAIDRYALRTINDSYANPRAYIKLTDAGGAESLRGKEGQVIPRPEFDQAVAELRQEFEAEVANVRDENKRAQLQEEFERNRLPQGEPPQPATGTVQFRSVTLLPSVQYTVPLLLLALSLWLSWRVVHLPVFADFLIATEAELNKVSWPTRKRLVQDTIVVLTTVVLMASYLLVVDLVWKEVLSSWPIQVLQLPADQTEANTSVEQKPW